MSEKLDIQSLFPGSVATECCRIDAAENDHELYPEELVSIENAIEKRQKEFGAGRTCARQALGRIGAAEGPLTKNQDGSIAWPEGIIGSVSHTRMWCGAAVANLKDIKGIGFDIETIERVKPHIWRKIVTPEEENWLAAQSEDQTQQWVALMFSAKEAVYKCLYPVVRKRMGFFDAIIVPDPQVSTFEIKLHELLSALVPAPLSLTGRYFFYEGVVFTGIVLK